MRIKKIIWAVDAFHSRDSAQIQALEALRVLLGTGKAEVFPVYVLTPQQLKLPGDLDDVQLQKYLPVAEKALADMIRALPRPQLEMSRHQVLVSRRGSNSEAVETLARYAQKVQADLIVVGTHGKRGVSRLFLGSFAETMLWTATVPILVVGPNVGPVSSHDGILFPTDFGNKSEPMFREVLRLAGELDAKVTLLHAIPNPVGPVIQSGIYVPGGGWVSADHYLENEEVRRRMEAELWIKRAAKEKVAMTAVIDTATDNVAESILSFAQKNQVRMIVMAAQSGRVSSAIVGSVTRQIVRAAPCPVWIIHPGENAAEPSS